MTRPRLLLLFALSAVGCPSTPPPKDTPTVPANARKIDISMHDIDCVECATALFPELKRVGAYDVQFDKKRAVLHIAADPTVPPEKFVQVVKDAGFGAELGDKGGSYLPQETFGKGGDVATPITDGHDIADLSEVAVAGKITVVDLFASWCRPCRDVDKHMSEILAKRSDVAYRKLDIVDWDSPLAVHHMKGVPNLPYVVVYGKDKSKIDAITGLDLQRLDKAIDKASK